MSKALWAHVALFAAAMSACASTQGSQREMSSSYLGGQAAQPSSWISKAPSDPAARSPVALTHQPAGQAAQQYSWLGDQQPAVPALTGLAQDGPSYLGGRAAQPHSWAMVPQSTGSSSLAAGPTSARQH